MFESIIVIRGSGEMATGVAHRLHVCGFKLLLTDIPFPLTVRRTVSFSECIFSKTIEVEGVTSVFLQYPALQEKEINQPTHNEKSDGQFRNAIEETWRQHKLPVIIDPELLVSRRLFGDAIQVVIDATINKKNIAKTNPSLAPLVIGLGPGFSAPKDVTAVIETNRGHDLGRVILEGSAAPDTGIPGVIKGESVRRVLRAPKTGVMKCLVEIGDEVIEGQTIAMIDDERIYSQLTGVVRGLLHDGVKVEQGTKVGDVDPRGKDGVDFRLISDKARALSGSVLEVIIRFYNKTLFPYSSSTP